MSRFIDIKGRREAGEAAMIYVSSAPVIVFQTLFARHMFLLIAEHET